MLKILSFLAGSLLLTTFVFGQTATKKPPTQVPVTSPAPATLLPDNTAAVMTLRAEQDSILQRITKSEAEEQKYAGGLIKAQIQSRIAVLRLTDALLSQRIAALQTGARIVLETAGTKPDPTATASLESEAATQKLKIEQARTDAERYSGGLIKAQKESTIATMESTLALIEQRALTTKYGLATPPSVASSSPSQASAVQAARVPEAPLKAKQQDEILLLRLVDKRYATQKYQDFVFFDIEFTASKLQKPARAIKGTLNINDLFGARQLGISWTIDRPMSPGESFVESGQGFKYNQFMDKHQWARATDRSNMAVTYTIESILYQDGTREDF
jgi:hypothetical protein